MISEKNKTMLFITDFPLKTTNLDIQDFLSKYKDKIISINQDQNPNNKEKRKPLSIKVLFKDYESANKCRIEMNLQKIHQNSIRIMWDEKDSSKIYNTKNNLFFTNIPKSITTRQVYEYFLKFGDICSCKMAEDENGNHYGYGYISFYKSEDAQKALEETKGKRIFDNNIIEISHFQKKNERVINSNNNQKLYISNLPEKFNTSNLTELCNNYGKVESCNIFVDNLGNNFGIVQFSSEEESKDVLNKLNNKELNDNILSVKLYQDKYENKQYLGNKLNENCNLLIKNIPLNAKEEDLIKIFGKFGNILRVKIEKYKKENNEGKIELINKGFGYISFDNIKSAKNAIETFNCKYLPGFESWSYPLIIELFTVKYETKIAENQEINILSYYTNSNNNEDNEFNENTEYNENNDINEISENYNNNSLIYNYNQFFQNNKLLSTLFPIINQNIPFYEKGMSIHCGGNYNYKYNNNNYISRRGGYHRYYKGNRNKNYYNKNRHFKNKRNKKIENEKKYKNEYINKIDLSEYYNLENEEDKKDFLGEKIFNAIQNSDIISEKKIDFKIIAKITGMIVELPDKNEIIEILENPIVLNERIEEALNLLKGQK